MWKKIYFSWFNYFSSTWIVKLFFYVFGPFQDIQKCFHYLQLQNDYNNFSFASRCVVYMYLKHNGWKSGIEKIRTGNSETNEVHNSSRIDK